MKEDFLEIIYVNKQEPFYQLFEQQNIKDIVELLEKRLRERNLILISEYFTSIRMQRIAELLECDIDIAEDIIVEMICNEKINGLINRLDNISVVFGDNIDCNLDCKLDAWTNGITNLMSQVESTSYMILNEEMISTVN